MIQLINGDCLEKMKDISSNSVDLFICDLPFGCLTNKTHKDGTPGETKGGKMYSAETGCAWDIPLDLEKFWKEVKRIRRNEHSPCIHFCTAKYGFDLYNSNPKDFRYDLVWAKPNAVGFLSANKMPLRSHELIYVFSKVGATYERIDISEKCVKSVIEFSNKKPKGGHPTAKPIELYKFLIERYCPKGGIVLDPTFGSGNSGLAAKELNRHYIGIEKDLGFYEKAKKRLE